MAHLGESGSQGAHCQKADEDAWVDLQVRRPTRRTRSRSRLRYRLGHARQDRVSLRASRLEGIVLVALSMETDERQVSRPGPSYSWRRDGSPDVARHSKETLLPPPDA